MGGAGKRTAIACLVLALGQQAAAAAERRVVGTLRVAGKVESALEPDGWRPLAAGAAVEGMSVRTGPKGSAAVLELSNGDLIGVAETSTIQVGTGEPLRLRLEEGHAAYRLQPGSKTVIETPRGTIRAPGADQAQAGEGVVMLDQGTTSVQGHRGVSELVANDGQVTTVQPGQVATLDADESGATVAGAGRTAGAGAEQGGTFDWFPSILGLSPGASAALVGGVVVAGAGAGIAAGVSGGGGDDSDGADQGSPFKPKKPKKPKKKDGEGSE
jgi:hypothetical protein